MTRLLLRRLAALPPIVLVRIALAARRDPKEWRPL